MTDHPSNPERDAEGKVVSAVDWLGHRFAVGEKVIYCVGAGKGQMMAIGEVLEIKVETNSRWDYRKAEPGEESTHFFGEPYVKFSTTYEEITVKVLTEKTSGGWNNGKRTRPAWVNPMNITALPVTAD